MKILIVTEYFPTSERGELTGGVEARIFYLSQELAKRHQVKVICSWKRGEPRNHSVGQVSVERVGRNHPYSNKGSFLSRLVFSIASYKAIVRNNDYEVVDGVAFSTYLPAYYGARKIGAKAVCTYHETWIGDWIRNKGFLTGVVGEILERLSLRCKWDMVMPVSHFTKRKLLEQGISEKKLHVVYNGVVLDEFKKVTATKKKSFRLVCVSRLIKTKRQETVLEAVQKLNDSSLEVVFVGGGDDESYYRRRVEEMGLSEQVTITGFLKTKKEVIQEMKRSSVLVHPSAVEGFGITVVEGMAAGLPVIVSDIAPLREVVGEGEYGLVFSLDDSDDLAEKIRSLQADAALYNEMKKKSMKRKKDFEWHTIAQEYERVVG
jgi:glycosyltransferase involved in cell wall biosynthesis